MVASLAVGHLVLQLEHGAEQREVAGVFEDSRAGASDCPGVVMARSSFGALSGGVGGGVLAEGEPERVLDEVEDAREFFGAGVLEGACADVEAQLIEG